VGIIKPPCCADDRHGADIKRYETSFRRLKSTGQDEQPRFINLTALLRRIFCLLTGDACNGISNPVDSNRSVIESKNQTFFEYSDSK